MQLFYYLTCFFLIISVVLKFYYDLFTAFRDTFQKLTSVHFFDHFTEYLWLMDDNITLLSNNVWGIENSHKKIKLFQYLKKNASPTVILFLQGTHSSGNDEIRWNYEFK